MEGQRGKWKEIVNVDKAAERESRCVKEYMQSLSSIRSEWSDKVDPMLLVAYMNYTDYLNNK